jgi:hypothetical protein
LVQVVLEESRESNEENMIHELASNTIDDLNNSNAQIQSWIENWKPDHA